MPLFRCARADGGQIDRTAPAIGLLSIAGCLVECSYPLVTEGIAGGIARLRVPASGNSEER